MHKNNSFDIARHFAALMVLFSHHHALSGLHEPGIEGFETYGGMAVIIFFSISGFLITKSAIRSSDFISFMTKRSKRIFPALIVCAIITNVLLSFIFTPSMPFLESLSRTVEVFTLNGAGLSATSPDFIHSQLINGSLWTLPLEVACYFIVGIILSIGNNKNFYILILIIFISLSVYTLTNVVGLNVLSIPMSLFPVRATAFFIGSIMALHVEKWNNFKIKSFILIALILFAYGSKDNPVNYIISCLMLFSVATIVLCISFKDPVIKGRFDYSYGIYIYSFPVQQIIISKTHFGFYTGMLISAVIVLFLACASWHLIENKFLKRAV